MSLAKLQARMRLIASERAKREQAKTEEGNTPKSEPKASGIPPTHKVTEHVEPSKQEPIPVLLGKSDIDV